MFFKFKGFYRQFSYVSLRLLNKKFLSTSSTTVNNILANSPSKSRKGFPLKSTWKTGNPEFRSFLQSELRSAYSQLQLKQREETREKFQMYQQSLKSKPVETDSLISDNKTTDPLSLALMFPLLTGEELKAFDSSVFEL